jgi:hypothetical protein
MLEMVEVAAVLVTLLAAKPFLTKVQSLVAVVLVAV